MQMTESGWEIVRYPEYSSDLLSLDDYFVSLFFWSAVLKKTEDSESKPESLFYKEICNIHVAWRHIFKKNREILR